ncbi:fms-related tyrosine kinase 3 ligand [Gopherus flavomarginatus]|uniref:fms-related tyrosine kinase 3 ligand n=1 Tax=Gopherus flavomarginatus TaxID=286002 RepID=UPI0021CC3119|nr:fms-related tyrosine kinase 3 ligand [Gopherus flavomarginatus]
MTWRHAPPDTPPPPGASVVPLLLLLVLVSPGHGCIFSFHPLSTTFSMAIDELTQHLLHDYPVSMPSNLEPDTWCAELWRIHFLAAELGHMGGVAGPALQPLVATVTKQVQFVQECGITDPMGCVGWERTNVSWMLSALNGHLAALRSKILRQAGPIDFSNCTPVRCQPAAPALSPAPLGLPQPGFSSQKQVGTQASGAGSLHQNHLPVLILLVPILVSLAFVWQRQRRLRGQDPRSHGRSRCSGLCDRGSQRRWRLGLPEPDAAFHAPLPRAKRRVESDCRAEP